MFVLDKVSARHIGTFRAVDHSGCQALSSRLGLSMRIGRSIQPLTSAEGEWKADFSLQANSAIFLRVDCFAGTGCLWRLLRDMSIQILGRTKTSFLGPAVDA